MKKRTVKAIKNPVIPNRGVCDPHLRVIGNRMALFCSHDKAKDSGGYCMEDWEIWSTDDFITFTQEKVIRPEETFMGKSPYCWATDGVERNGKIYFYFSDGGEQTGVLVASALDGAYQDPLHKPLVAKGEVCNHAYDPGVFVDDDGTPYLVFGAPAWAYGEGEGYFIARLNEDMISFAEPPRRLQLDHPADDKASLHKEGGVYYLTYRNFYAVSDNVYGPYRFKGSVGVSSDHGSYEKWKGQWYHSFTIQDPTDYHRATGICYVHYRKNGEMVCDQLIAEYGVGHYDGRWNQIEAEWYTAANSVVKKENDVGGFSVSPQNGKGELYFPHVSHTAGKSAVLFFVQNVGAGSRVSVSTQGGEVLLDCELPAQRFNDYRGARPVLLPLNRKITEKELCLCITLQGEEDLLSLDWFRLV